jgi:hypothetical protein
VANKKVFSKRLFGWCKKNEKAAFFRAQITGM